MDKRGTKCQRRIKWFEISVAVPGINALYDDPSYAGKIALRVQLTIQWAKLMGGPSEEKTARQDIMDDILDEGSWVSPVKDPKLE